MIQLKHLLENIDTSKIRIRSSMVNGLLVYVPTYDSERMGAFRLKPYGDDWQIDSVLLYDRYKGMGLGKGMYRFIIKHLATQYKKLYSDKLQSQDARNVWESLVNDGLAISMNDGTYVSKVNS
jgi:hypothetical protein